MSAKAYLPADYTIMHTSAVHEAMDDLRGVILRRQAQEIIIAKQASDDKEAAKFRKAMMRVAVFETVLDDIAVAIQREQGR
jgi:hypothetical protein